MLLLPSFHCLVGCPSKCYDLFLMCFDLSFSLSPFLFFSFVCCGLSGADDAVCYVSWLQNKTKRIKKGFERSNQAWPIQALYTTLLTTGGNDAGALRPAWPYPCPVLDGMGSPDVNFFFGAALFHNSTAHKSCHCSMFFAVPHVDWYCILGTTVAVFRSVVKRPDCWGEE